VFGSLRSPRCRLPVTYFFSILRRHCRSVIAVARNKPRGLDTVEQQERQFLVALPSWGAFGCEIPQSAPYALLGPELMGVSSPCGHDEFVPTLLVIEYPTATPQGQQPGEYVGDIGGSTSVTVDGVLGTRQTATVTVDTGLNPAKGALQVVYRFTTAGRTYVATYTREPGEPDLTTEVDNLVEGTFRFSA
jgi:hypothetical protein